MVRLLQILLLLCVLNVSLLSEAFVRDHSVSPAVTGSQHSRLYFSDERKYWQTRENDILSGEVALKERLRKYEAEALKRKTAAKNKVVNNTSAVSTTVSTNQGKTDGLSNQADESNQWKIPLPFMNLQSVGAKGRWEERKGNFVLRPPGTTRPFAVIHFMGGAFVGAAPHLTYRYLLESLAQEGYVIVATPYRLDMDYLRSCDSILSKFDALAVELAEEYGALPVVGMGHSCGKLFFSN